MDDTAYALDISRSGKATRAIVLRALVPMVASDAPRSWVHIAYEGEWKGHPRGPFELTDGKFRAMVERFNARKNPVPVDYEHASVKTDGRNGVPAAGWIHRLELRSSGLWAEVEWTARAADMIKAGEYRFCSGVFVFDDVDEKTGGNVDAELFNLALTNTPFIDGQTPIALSLDKRIATLDASQIVAQIAKALGLEDSADASSIVTAIEGLVKLRDAQSGEASAPAAEVVEPSAPDVEEMKKVPCADVPAAAPAVTAAPATQDPSTVAAGEEALALLRQALKLPDNADAAAVLAALRSNVDAIASACSGGAPEAAAGSAVAASRVVYESTIRALTKEVTELRSSHATKATKDADEKKKQEEHAALATLDKLVSCGRVLDAERGAWLEIARKDPATFRALSASLVEVVPQGEAAPPPPPKQASNLTLSDADEAKVQFFVRAGVSRADAERQVAGANAFMNQRRGRA